MSNNPSPSADAARSKASSDHWLEHARQMDYCSSRCFYAGWDAHARLAEAEAERKQQEARENFDTWLLRVGKDQRNVPTWEAWEAAWRHSQALMTPELERLDAIERAALEYRRLFSHINPKVHPEMAALFALIDAAGPAPGQPRAGAGEEEG